jgi:single-stranded DNA-binding protein
MTEMLHNDFEITGRVTYVNVTYTDGGTAIVRTCVSKKSTRKEGEFIGLWVNMFGEVAEKYAEQIKQGDTVNIKGKLDSDKFTTKDGKASERMVLKGWSFQKAMYDKDSKTFVPFDPAKVETTEAAKESVKEDTPWG